MQSPGRTVQAAGRARRTSSVALRRGHHERTESRRGRAGPQGRASVRTAAESGSARRSLGKVRRAGTRSGAHLPASPRWPPRLDFGGESPRNGVFTSQGTERTLHRLSRGRASASRPGARTASDADAAGPSGPPAAPPSRPVTLRPRPAPPACRHRSPSLTGTHGQADGLPHGRHTDSNGRNEDRKDWMSLEGGTRGPRGR